MRYLLTLTCLFSIIAVHAADTTSFHLVVNKGRVQYREQAKSGWYTLTSKDTIDANSTIRIEKFSYVLIKSDQGFLEFNIKGTYNLSEYLKYLTPQSPLIKKYEQLVHDSLTLPAKQGALYKKELLDVKTDSRDLLSMYPPPTIIYDDKVTLRWRPMDKNIYVIKMFHSEYSTYFLRELSGDHVTVDMTASNFPTDRCIYWTVGIKGSEYVSKPKCVYILNILESSNIVLPAYEMEQTFNLERSAYHNLIMAFFYESERVQHKAELHYEKAWSLSNDCPRYKQLYYDFLERRNTLHID